MADVHQPEGQIGLDERSQHFQIGIILQIRQLHGERIVRTRTKIQEEWRDSWHDLRTEKSPRESGSRLMRALETTPAALLDECEELSEALIRQADGRASSLPSPC